MDKDKFDFRPKPGSALIDKGTIFPPYSDGFKGTAPDLGAYESGAENWRAGHDWGGFTSVEKDQSIVAADFELGLNYPNPFNASTQMAYRIRKSSRVRIIVYDLLGRQIRLLEDQKINPGLYSIGWDGRDDHGGSVSTGVYFIFFQAGDVSGTRKVLLVR
jgi:hypothetical protein